MAKEESEKKGFFSRVFRKDKTEATERPSADADSAAPSVRQPSSSDDIYRHDDEASARGLSRLSLGLKKTREGFIRSLDDVFLGDKELDDKVITRLEEALVTADIGVKTAYELLDSVTERVKRKELNDPDAVMAHLKRVIFEILSTVESPLRVGYGPSPFVALVVGVNGAGKTTTIAKIAARHVAAGGKVMMVAGDTFRAAAVEQMEVWGERIGCPVVKGRPKADPSSVAFEALKKAQDEGVHLVLVDTAGRLHTRVPLMEELRKIKRTLAKVQPDAPQETLLVIDASNGQNAIHQASTFNEAVPLTGLALTKLDGTAKGGVLVGISNELNIPVRYIGIGEKMDDLRDFNAREFTEALFASSPD